MSIPVITQGATTDHGGVVNECFETFTIDGKKVHLDGMKHFCPKCNKEVFAIASNPTKTMMGRAWVLEGDKASCGATFIANQGMAFVGNESNSTASNAFGVASTLVEATKTYREQFQLVDQYTKEILKNVEYRLSLDNKVIGSSFTDENGYTKVIESDHPAEIKVEIRLSEEEEDV